jgi:hypothetical protein
MNPSSAPASNETVAYGPLLAQASKLKRSDQVNLVRALAGQLGMISVFPNQLVQQAGTSSTAPKGAEKKKAKKGPAQQEPSNPLSGSPEKKEFDAAKKAVSNATKENGGQKLASSNELVVALEKAKDQYFRSLSNAKGSKPAQPSGWASEVEAEASTSKSPAKPAATATSAKSPTPKSQPKK